MVTTCFGFPPPPPPPSSSKLHPRRCCFGCGLPLEFRAVSNHFLPRAWLTNAATLITTSVQNKTDQGEYSSGPWKCSCLLSASRWRPSLLRQLAKMIYKYSHPWLSHNGIKHFRSGFAIFPVLYFTHLLSVSVQMVSSFWLRSATRTVSHHRNQPATTTVVKNSMTSPLWKRF